MTLLALQKENLQKDMQLSKALVDQLEKISLAEFCAQFK